MASQNVRSSFYFWVFFFIMCYHANILEHLPNSIFEFCSNFAVYIIINLLAELKNRLKISIFLWRKSCASR